MGGRFCFFTDPALLGPQSPVEAFGPQPPAGGGSNFLVTDLHSAVAGSPAIAVCDGLVCAQEYPDGNLSLILKPISQPAFTFPLVSYFIYKGLARDSLLNADNTLAATLSVDNELIDACLESWSNPANENGTAPADMRCLGLHLNATSDPQKYTDDSSIDRLFYDGDADFPPVKVDAGDRLGKFGPLIGFEIIVERLGHSPLIGWTRALRHEISASILTGSEPGNSVAAFRHWHDKEQILGFVDPCAFWGAFVEAELAKSKVSARIAGSDVYPKVLRGANLGDNPDGAFFNRNMAYFDIRNEHGQSLDYYGSVGRSFELVVGDGADIDTGVRDYYASGWPCHRIESSALTALSPAPVGQVPVRIALPKTDFSAPLIYVGVGYTAARGGKAVRPLKGQERFIAPLRRNGSPYLEPATIAVPIVTVNGQARLHASYQKISHFKRYDPKVTAANNPASIGPPKTSLMGNVLPIPGPDPFPKQIGGALAKTYATEVFVQWPSDSSSGFVARPGFAQDGANVYLYLLPTRRFLYQGALEQGLDHSPPVFQDLDAFLPHFLKVGGKAFRQTLLKPQSLSVDVHAIREDHPGAVRDPLDPQSAFILLILPRTIYQAAVAPAGQSATWAGTGLLSINLSELLIDSGGWPYREAAIGYSSLSSPSPQQPADIVTRSSSGVNDFPKLYAYADL